MTTAGTQHAVSLHSSEEPSMKLHTAYAMCSTTYAVGLGVGGSPWYVVKTYKTHIYTSVIVNSKL